MIPIKLLILDVDGVLTTGALPYNADGNEERIFNVQDGGAIRMWQAAGGVTAVISGRKTPAVDRRTADLGIEIVFQGLTEKMGAYEEACRRVQVRDEEVAFVGDDFVDFDPMRRCGYAIAVANATPRIKRIARYVTRRSGGMGAVTEAIERLLRHNGTWAKMMSRWELEVKSRGDETSVAQSVH